MLNDDRMNIITSTHYSHRAYALCVVKVGHGRL